MSNISIFTGFAGTIPSYSSEGLEPLEVAALMAGQLQIEPEKKRVRYATPIVFKISPYVGGTAKWKLTQGETEGVQRSAVHADGCKAKHVVFDFDKILPEQTAQVFEWLKSANVMNFGYSSHSHGKDGVLGDCFRLVVFLDAHVHGVQEYGLVWRGIAHTHFPGLADTSSSRPYQMQGCWATAPERVEKAWCTKNITKGVPLSTHEYLELGRRVVESSPFGSAGIIGSATLTLMNNDASIVAGMMVPLQETPEQREIYDALCMLDSGSTELLIAVYGCLKAVGHEYQGHFENWVYSNPGAIEKYRSKHPTKYNVRFMWAENGWSPTISKDQGIGKLKSLARASAWRLVQESEVDSDEATIALAYLDKYHPRWLDKLLSELPEALDAEGSSHE
jgi:hypothetical protein